MRSPTDMWDQWWRDPHVSEGGGVLVVVPVHWLRGVPTILGVQHGPWRAKLGATIQEEQIQRSRLGCHALYFLLAL